MRNMGSTGIVRPSRLPLLPARQNRSSMQVCALLNRAATKPKDVKEEEIIIPMNYSQMLGLKGREMYLDPQITTAHEDLFHADLDPAYSSVARLGKEKLLYAAREGLRAARGRVSLTHPDVTIEPALLPGCLALLEQGGHYELVIQLAQQAQRISPAELRTKNRATVRDYERDVALATALAHCGMAKTSLEAGHSAMGCARLEEALHTLREGASGGTPLAPELQSNITNALEDLKADAVLDYLREPLDLAEVTLRQQAVAALATMLQRPAGITPEYAARALASLTGEEVCRLLDWERVVASKDACPWYFSALLPKVGLAHLVAGFTHRRPGLVATGRQLLMAAASESDVAVPLAVSKVLLGQPLDALDALREDERQAASLRAKSGARAPPSPRPAPRGSISPAFPERDSVMAFVRIASPEGENDLLPGLCLFVEQWLQRVAFPQIRDTQERAPSASLALYFEDPKTASFLESNESGGPIQAMQSVVAAAARGVAGAAKDVGNGAYAVIAAPMRTIVVLKSLVDARWVAAAVGAAAITMAVVLGAGRLDTRRRTAAQAPGGTAASFMAAPHRFSQQSSGQKSPSQTQGKQAVLSKNDAQSLVQQWLSIKAEAMGPRHTTSRLSSVLAEPMLGAVASEAREAASSGWFWNIRPLKARVDSVDCSTLTPEGGYAVVVATVDESADLWATNGKKGDSYKTTYRVEYSIVRGGGGWKLASALVLGKP